MPHDKRNNGPSDSAGVMGQMSRLRAHSGATAAELRAFVQQLRGRSPQEVIGMIAQSNLVRATALAAAATVALLLVFTILPALMAKDKPAPAAPAAAKQNEGGDKAASADAAAKADANAAAANAAAAKAKDAKSDTPSKADIADKLGIGDAKTPDPKKNPLDDIGNDLFKDVK